jgi:uncharacterized protein YneF (UPF0154 family)
MASTPPPAPQTPMPPMPPARKATSPWVWVAVGCGGILVVAFIIFLLLGVFFAKKVKNFAEEAGKNPAMAAARLAAAADPDVEVVSTDDAANTITLRNKKTGETITLDVSQVKKGAIKFLSEKGEVTIGGGEQEPPAWVPRYPGVEPQPMYSSQGEGEHLAGWHFKTPDDPGKVLSFYESHLKADGFSVSTNMARHEGKAAGGLLTATAENQERQVMVTVTTEEPGSTSVAVTVNEKGK